jgi:predicted ester cyclase
MRAITSTVLHKWFNQVWNDDNEQAIEKLMTPGCVAHGIVSEELPGGPETFRNFFRGFRKEFQNIHIDVEDVVVQEDMETARTTVHATHSPTGKNVTFSGICMAKIQDGKIAEAWNNYDFLNMYQQIGQKLVDVEHA